MTPAQGYIYNKVCEVISSQAASDAMESLISRSSESKMSELELNVLPDIRDVIIGIQRYCGHQIDDIFIDIFIESEYLIRKASSILKIIT